MNETEPTQGAGLSAAVISKIPLFPTTGGNRARVLGLCQGLQALGCNVRFVLIPSRQMRDFDEASHVAALGPDRFDVLHRSWPSALRFYATALRERLRSSLRRRLGLRNAPRSDVDYLFPSGIAGEIDAIARRRDIDLVCVEYVHFSRILTLFPESVFKVLDTHDSFRDEFTPGAEAEGFLRAHRVIACQEEEAELFRRQLGEEGHRVIEQSHLLRLSERLELGRTIGATFLGSSFEANRLSLRWFVDRVLPAILERAPTFKLVVAGSICADIADHPAIIKLGRVPDVADAFRAAPILVNPIQAGTGVKIKLLDAMGLGLPCVSTSLGLVGLNPAYREGVVEVPDADVLGFADAVVRLTRDDDERRRLGERSFAAARHWNEAQTRRLETLVGEARRHRDRHRGPGEARFAPGLS